MRTSEEFRDEKSRILKRYESLKNARSALDGQQKELSRYMLPMRGRFGQGAPEPRKRHSAIVNNTPLIAARNLAAGMMSGLTSPARPWFRLSVPDREAASSAAVKAWLEMVEQGMRDQFIRSNLYTSLAIAYSELGVFGTAAIAVSEDWKDGIRAMTFTAGEYVLAAGERGTVDTVMRETVLTVGQAAERFGRKNLSSRARDHYDRGDYDLPLPVLHVVEPNRNLEPGSSGHKGKRIKSVYLELQGDAEGFLSVGGFDEMPVLCPRWALASEDVYGHSPAMDALGDSIALQTLEKKRAQALEKLINPPMVADPSLRNQPATVLPGGVTYVSGAGSRPAFAPAYQIAPPLAEIRIEIAAHEERIRRAFYEDLFLMLAGSDRRSMTAREVEERHEEKLLMLGPVLERLHDELLDPLIERVFGIMNRNRMLAPPPRELMGRELKVEYTSVLAQAQKAAAASSLEAFTGFVGRLSALDPQVADCVDWDGMVLKNAEAVGVTPTVLKTAQEIRKAREQRALALAAGASS